MHPTVRLDEVMSKFCIVWCAAISVAAFLYTTSTTSKPLTSSTALTVSTYMAFLYDFPQESNYFELYYILYSSVRSKSRWRLYVVNWWVVVCINYFLDQCGHFCTLQLKICLKLCCKYFRVAISCLLHCGAANVPWLRLCILEIWFENCSHFCSGKYFIPFSLYLFRISCTSE